MAEGSFATYTGERPGWGEGFDYDESRHLAAYEHARTLASGKHVLDAGCGEGFGTQTLTGVAAAVKGIDYSPIAIDVCRTKWRHPKLSFECVDLTKATSEVETFDLVLNFQVIEHIEDPRPFLRGLKARIGQGGRLMLTTPNRLSTFSENPYHVREYTASELRSLLAEMFSSVELLGMHGNAKVTAFDAGRERAVKRILRMDPLGIRKLLPTTVVNAAFARLSVLVRKQAKRAAATDRILPTDFFVSGDRLDEALDLVAMCRP